MHNRTHKKRGVWAVVPLVGTAALCAGIALFNFLPMLEGLPEMQATQAYASQSASVVDADDVEDYAWQDIDWEALRAINPDVVGWVSIPGTNVNFAIVQEQDGSQGFYLNHDLYGKRSYYGCPYVPAECAEVGGIDAVAPIVYGHNLANGLMFTDLAKYSSAEFAREHGVVLVQTPTERRALQVIGANVVDANTERITGSFTEAADAFGYLNEKLDESEVVLSRPLAGERVFQLVSCSYQTSNSRTIVYAVEM